MLFENGNRMMIQTKLTNQKNATEFDGDVELIRNFSKKGFNYTYTPGTTVPSPPK